MATVYWGLWIQRAIAKKLNEQRWKGIDRMVRSDEIAIDADKCFVVDGRTYRLLSEKQAHDYDCDTYKIADGIYFG